jgi:hypothetical protein
MRWLIIAPCQDPDTMAAENFLAGYKAEYRKIFIYKGLSHSDFLKDLKDVLQVTHCIIVGSAEMHGVSDYAFVLGVLTGQQVRTFIYTGGAYEKDYEELNIQDRSFFHCYDNLSEMFNFISTKYEQYRIADLQRTSMTKLLTLGIPFTSDSFAKYIAKDDTETCNVFRDAGMLANAYTAEGVPMLCVATRNDCFDKVKWLLDQGADINAVAKDRGYSAVMDAVWRKNYDITEFLISKGAKLDFISSDGQPILVLAVGNGNVRIVELLLEHGADPDIKDSMGMSARGYANLFKKPALVELMEKYPPKTPA